MQLLKRGEPDAESVVYDDIISDLTNPEVLARGRFYLFVCLYY
jgi:hypothetical protein